MDGPEPANVRNELPQMKGGTSAKHLVFDQSGQLVLRNRDELHRPSDIVVDQIYRDGFFAQAA